MFCCCDCHRTHHLIRSGRRRSAQTMPGDGNRRVLQSARLSTPSLKFRLKVHGRTGISDHTERVSRRTEHRARGDRELRRRPAAAWRGRRGRAVRTGSLDAADRHHHLPRRGDRNRAVPQRGRDPQGRRRRLPSARYLLAPPPIGRATGVARGLRHGDGVGPHAALPVRGGHDGHAASTRSTCVRPATPSPRRLPT
jgi:hypothetical protein